MKKLCICVLVIAAQAAYAHPEIGDYLQHRIALDVKSDHLNLTVEITFDAGRSQEERKKIDKDSNAVISNSERKAYLDQIEAGMDGQIQILINDKPVTLIALYTPELDLFDSRDLDRHPHVLRLSYFAEAKCAPGDVIKVVDTLWPNEPAIMLADASESESGKVFPREQKNVGNTSAKQPSRDIVFDITAPNVGSLVKPATGHMCGPACRHRSASKGRPAASKLRR